MSPINDSRKTFEEQLQKVTGANRQVVSQLTDRLIDLVKDMRDELRRNDGK